VAEATKKLNDVYEAQKKLKDKTGDAKPEDAAAIAKEQRDLEAQAGELARS